jgi:ArsR family transcriptional regulator, lead/cadmium/zinc/bismuth-responsive transcriptional repressor
MTLDHAHPIDAQAVVQARAAVPTADETARLAGLLSVMADPLRLRIVFALDETDELCVGDLALALEVSEDAAGYALRLLRAAGLVTTRKDGRVVYNQLSPEFPEPLLHYCLRELIKITRDGAVESAAE